MSYQVIARKWRPQKFDDVVGQQVVTRTLRNALASRRLAQAFVFAGPRGVGKTTTARILARALSCQNGPTPDPCGVCEACVEIAEGRDIDVLEIDAATHTQVENIRDVIITGLAIAPVRNRYKIFIIDEVHQLSGHSFNALLKSIEEPPPHVVFMMATTELEKIPETVLSRSQVYEFRTIGARAIADQLRLIVDADAIEVGEESLQLIARDADGSMRDAQSKLEQVIAFTGKTIAAGDVATVLGLVGRDVLFDAIQAVADQDAPAAFSLAATCVEMGSDLRLVCRELSRMVRDLLVLSVDPSRVRDPEIAGEGERERLTALAARFSREDLLRAFDLLTRAENDIRTAAQPRYHLEMALLRWIYLRKLVPIEDLIASAGSASSGTLPSKPATPAAQPAARGREPAESAARAAPKAAPSSVPGVSGSRPPGGSGSSAGVSGSGAPGVPGSGAPGVPGSGAPGVPGSGAPGVPGSGARPGVPGSGAPGVPGSGAPGVSGSGRTPQIADVASAHGRISEASFKDALLAEIRKSKVVFYNTVVAQAQKIEITADQVTFTFSAAQRALREMFEQHRSWLESLAAQVGGRKVAVTSANGAETTGPATPAGSPEAAAKADKKNALREQALADAGVQALLEVFPAEIRDVEEM
jgi:DNA polymerase III subunit gamma/tau